MNLYFVCIGNAGRSQMAQALAEREGFDARSAYSRPESELHRGDRGDGRARSTSVTGGRRESRRPTSSGPTLS